MEKSHNETEILSADEQKLRDMCQSLKKVDAPANFDFKLKARMTSAKPSEFAPRFGFAFRYALPALALILVLGLLAYTGGFLSTNSNPTIVRSSEMPSNPETTPPQNTTVAGFAPPEAAKKPEETIEVATAETAKTTDASQPRVAVRLFRAPKKDLPNAKKDNFVGWKQEALGIDKPKQLDLNANSAVPKTPAVEQRNSLSMKEVLTENGISADFENGKWTVKSVRANSPGESSGVREKDIIEALDNQQVDGANVVNKTVKNKILTVMRDGEKLQIELRANP